MSTTVKYHVLSQTSNFPFFLTFLIRRRTPGLFQRQGAEQEHQPRRGGRLRRRRPGRHPQRRHLGGRAGPAPARRGAPLARHRDGRRRHDPAHQAQHHHTHQAVAGVHHLRGQPAGRDGAGDQRHIKALKSCYCYSRLGWSTTFISSTSRSRQSRVVFALIYYV